MNVCVCASTVYFVCRIAVSLLLWQTRIVFVENDFISMEVEHLQMVSKSFNSVASKALEFIHKCMIPIQFHQAVCVCVCVCVSYHTEYHFQLNSWQRKKPHYHKLSMVWVSHIILPKELYSARCWKIAAIKVNLKFCRAKKEREKEKIICRDNSMCVMS